jgi:hypothetical protein
MNDEPQTMTDESNEISHQFEEIIQKKPEITSMVITQPNSYRKFYKLR